MQVREKSRCRNRQQPVEKEQHLVDALCAFHERTGEKMILIIDEWDAMFRECKGQTHILDAYILLLRSLLLCKKYQKDYVLMQQWYDGYFVGGMHVYNPKSVMESILRNKFSSYWTKTETYEALRDYIDMNFDGLKDAVIDMLGGAVCEVDTGSFQNDMTSMKSKDDVLTLLIHLGYLFYDEEKQTVGIPNVEIRQEFVRAIKNGNRTELMKAIQRADDILKATWQMDGRTVAELINEIHDEDTATVFYNNEQALRSVVKMAYLSSVDKPALLVELKWNKTKEHSCLIEKAFCNNP